MTSITRVVVGVLLAFSPFALSAADASLRFVVTDLGVLDSAHPTTLGAAINGSGIVVGDADVGGSTHPFYWDGKLHDIGTLGGPSGHATDINDTGTIVGWADPGPDLFAFQNGSKVDLGIPPGAFDYLAAYINADDVVLAYPLGDNKCDDSTSPFVVHLRTSPTRLPLRFFCLANVFGIDNQGEVLGDPYIKSRFTYGFINSFGRDFDPLGTQSDRIHVSAINRETDTVIGYISKSNNDFGAYFEPATNTLVRLPPLSQKFRTSLPFGINRSGQIVGTACTATANCDGGNVAFLFVPTLGMMNLNAVAPIPSGFSEYVATAINDSGQIVVVGANPPSGPDRTFLLTPRR